MALAKFGNGIIEMAGSQGGVYYHRDKSGSHVAAMPRKINRQPVVSQRNRRKAFRQCINYINKNTTAQLGDQWEVYAQQHPITNKVSCRYVMSWRQAFIQINIARLYNNLDIEPVPPI